jgi:5-methylcytosine-specific restriction endonuclease McrA
MTKKERRQIIFNKYNGRCAYCGCELEKGWHVDELYPVKRNFTWNKDKTKYIQDGTCKHPERFNIDNQMPACASCNINKHSMSLEDFRLLIQGFIKHLNVLNTQYKIAKRYGLVKEDIHPIEFYFEIKTRQDKLLNDPNKPWNYRK